MLVLITRPLEEAEALAATLKARGLESLIEPLIAIKPLEAAVPALDGVQALLFTSANGVRAFAAGASQRDLPVFAVGARTAEVAREVGFERVESADGAVEDLARLVRKRLDPKKGALFHGAGAEVKGDLSAMLAPNGFEVRRTVLYEAMPASSLSGATLTALRDGRLDAVLFFSPRSAEIFVNLVRSAGVEGACGRLAAICLSPSVAEAARALRWREVSIASRSEQAALVELLAQPSGEKKAGERAGDQPEGKGAGVDSPAQRAIRAFGGIRPMASKLGVPVTTVQGWKERGHIPEARIPELMTAAAIHGITLTDAELKDLPEASPPATQANGAQAETITSPAPGPAAAKVAPPQSAGTAELKPSTNHEQAKEAPPAAAARAARQRVGLVPALWAMALAALMLAAAVSLPYWGARVGLVPEGQRSAAAELAALKKRTTALESIAAELSNRLEQRSGADGGKIAALESRLSGLGDANAKLAAQASSLQQQLGTLQEKIKKIQEADPRYAALALAVVQLQEALMRSGPYEKPLATVAALGQGESEIDAALATLKTHAAAGIPTIAELTRRFDAVSVAAARAAIAPAEHGWIGAILARFSRLVVVRRANGEVAGEGPQAVLARAEARLEKGNLPGAVAALSTLEDEPAKAVKPWLDDAQARLAAEEALNTLARRVIGRLGESPVASSGTPR